MSNTFQCEWLAQGSVVSGRKLVVQREKHCLVLNWFVVFDLSCGHNLHNVLTECIISDHRAVAVSIQCSHLPEFDDEVIEPQPGRIDWLKVTAQEREDYYHKSKNLLDQLQVPTEVRHCQNFDCTDEKHPEEIENLYAELTSALLPAASSAIKTTGKKNEGKFNISGWNSVVKSKHQIAKAAFRLCMRAVR